MEEYSESHPNFFFFTSDPVDCEYIETESSDTALLTVAYVMAGVCGLCLVPIFILLAQASCKKRQQRQRGFGDVTTKLVADGE